MSLFDHATEREVIAPGGRGNLLQLHQDVPNQWDAWDVDKPSTAHTFTDLVELDELAAVRRRRRRRGGRHHHPLVRRASEVTQVITLDADTRRLDIHTHVDWHETETFLKVAFPLDVRADRSAAETQFGHLYRPTHTNTSWDAAKFEACNPQVRALRGAGLGCGVGHSGRPTATT